MSNFSVGKATSIERQVSDTKSIILTLYKIEAGYCAIRTAFFLDPQIDPS
jgi:hypothetical protein